jgi:hypothetical protein
LREIPLAEHGVLAIIREERGWAVDVTTRKTDGKARVTLPRDFASCLVQIERHGQELRLRKVQKVVGRRYSFEQLMAGVTADNIHAEVPTGPAVGREVL